MKTIGMGVLLSVVATAALAQTAAPTAPQTPPAPALSAQPAPSGFPTLPAKTPVTVKLLAPVGSKISKIDERFPIELAEPVVIDGVTLVPAGLKGEGEVVHAARARWGGKAGELILAVRFLQCGPVKLPIGRFRYSQAGSSRTTEAALAASLITPAMFLVGGGEVNVPAGTLATAQTIADVQLPMAAGAACPVP